MKEVISCGGTPLSKKPKYIENFWKNLIFIYACLILSITLSLSVNSINLNKSVYNSSKVVPSESETTTEIILDAFLTFLYVLASSILIAISVYLYKNSHQTFEEAKKENSKSSKIHYSMCGEKVGLYLRFGVVLIGLLSLIHIALSNARTKAYKIECLRISTLCSSISEIVFFIIQAIFILKYHSIVILKNIRLIKFGLYNIIFINIAIWEISSITKIKYANHYLLTNTECQDTSNETLFLYFLPAVSEYCVICMAIIYEIMKRLGKGSLIETSHEEHQKDIFWKIRKSKYGICIGIAIVLIAIGITSFIIKAESETHDMTYVFLVHNIEEIVLYIFSIIILLITFSKTNQLKFSFTYLFSNVDRNLLFISCFMSIAFSILLSTYCFQNIGGDNNVLLRAISSLLEIVQIIIQTYIIQDAFYRCSDNIEQQKSKPGQDYLGILIGINFALWLFKSFQLKSGDVFFNKKGPLYKEESEAKTQHLLTFFVYLTLPLSILYRYHSSSCLADVFSKIYQGEVCRFENILRAEGFDNFGMAIKEELPNNNPAIVISDISPKLGRPRAITLPAIPQSELPTSKGTPRSRISRRETIKNLETAKLRVLSSQFSHNMVNKKLSSTVAPSFNSSTSTLNECETEKSPKPQKKFNSFHDRYSNTDMPTVKHLVVGNIFHSSLKKAKPDDDDGSVVSRVVKFNENPISEHYEEE